MANSNGWGDGSVNNNIGWGQAPNNNISWGKSQITSWSGATDIDGGNAPVNTVAPAITGTAQEGQTLTCSTGTWSGSPTYTYQWKRNGSNIGSATNSTYVLVTADVGQSIKCTVTATNFIGSANADSNTVTPTSSVDADAQAFITAASITNPTQQAAINTLVVDLKGYSIWTKFKAIYPIVGGSASSHAVNLKTPGTFNLTFATGWTHSANGMQGTNAYADTGLNLVTNSLNTYNVHYSTYFRDNTASGIDMGVTSSGSGYISEGWFLASGGVGGIMQGGFYDQDNLTNGGIRVAITDSRGFWVDSAVASNNIFVRRNNTSVGTFTGANGSTPANGIIPIGGCRNVTTNSFIAYSTHQWAFCSIGNGLTTTEAANFYTAVQAFQTTLSRQV